MSIESQEMKVTVQVNIKGYRNVQALKDICVIAKEKIENWNLLPALYPGKKGIRINELIEEILDLP